MQRGPLAGAAVLAALWLACSSPPPEPGPTACGVEYLGERAKDIELEVTALGAAPPAHAVADGQKVPLIFPPQGGRVIFVGVRARNLDPCGVTLLGAIRDPATRQVRIDKRTVNLASAGAGWGACNDTDISTFANVPVCPNSWATTDAFGRPFQLEVTLTDRDGRSATKTLTVTPECGEPASEAECRCICQGGYVLGQACGAADGGADAGDAAAD